MHGWERPVSFCCFENSSVAKVICTDERWLLVFDNADDPEVLRTWWPVSSHGKILVTSRDPGAAKPSQSLKRVKVNPLSDSESAQLLLSLVHRSEVGSNGNDALSKPDDTAIARSLAERLGGLPLAINQVASYILDSDCTLGECEEIYSDISSRNDLLIQQSNTVDTNYEHSLGNVWDLSMSRVRKQNVNSVHLLEILSLLDPDSVPELLLTGKGRLESGAPRKALSYLANIAQFINARKFLLQQSMITKSGTDANSALSIHRLVSAITQESLTGDDRQDRFDDVLELLIRQFPQVSLTRPSLNDQWPRCRVYISQVIALETFYRQSNPPLAPRSDFCTLISNACWYLFETGQLAQATHMLPTAKLVGEATLPDSRFSLTTVYRALGGIALDCSNDPVSVQTHWSRVLQLQKDISEFATAHGYTLMASVELALGNPVAAKKNVTIAQDIRARHGVSAKGYKAMTTDVLGGIEAQSGNWEVGLQHYQEAISLYDEDMGIGNYWSALWVSSKTWRLFET
jgi:hypothetical protein